MNNSTKTVGKKVNLKVLAKRLLIIFLFVYLLIALISQQFNFVELRKSNAVVDAKIEEALQQQDSLNTELQAIDSEDFIRRTIREKLGYTRPNEKVFVDATK